MRKRLRFYYSSWRELAAWQRISMALVLGILSGLALGSRAEMLRPLGELFINALHMVIVPVIFSTVVVAIIANHNLASMRRITIKAFVIYFASLCLASILAVVVGTMLQPGHSVALELLGNTAVDHIHAVPQLVDVLKNLIPYNPLQAFVNENIMQIVVFSVMLGLAVNYAGEKAKALKDILFSLADVAMHLTKIVMEMAPFGIFALMAWTTGTFGLAVLWPLMHFIFSVFLGCVLLVVVFYFPIIMIYLRESPIKFIRAIFPAMIFACSTTSSAATLPVSIGCAVENLRLPRTVAQFLLPLGCNFNLSGLAIYLTMTAIFTANVYGIHLTWDQYFTIIATVVVTTMGTGAVPGSALVVMGAVLTGVGLPLGAIHLVASVDRINDMIQTTTNVTSDIFAAYVVSATEKN